MDLLATHFKLYSNAEAAATTRDANDGDVEFVLWWLWKKNEIETKCDKSRQRWKILAQLSQREWK